LGGRWRQNNDEALTQKICPHRRHDGNAGNPVSMALPCARLERFGRNIFAFAGIASIRETLIGMEDASEKTNQNKWMSRTDYRTGTGSL
jgi:hypothetical protein